MSIFFKRGTHKLVCFRISIFDIPIQANHPDILTEYSPIFCQTKEYSDILCRIREYFLIEKYSDILSLRWHGKKGAFENDYTTEIPIFIYTHIYRNKISPSPQMKNYTCSKCKSNAINIPLYISYTIYICSIYLNIHICSNACLCTKLSLDIYSASKYIAHIYVYMYKYIYKSI